MSEITYTPNGIPRAPGFINPTNPYDTGRQGEKNTELNGGMGGTPYGWDRELQQWVSGPGSSNDQPPGGGGGGGGGGGVADAYYQQLKSMLDAQGAAQRGDTRAAIQQALIGFGLVPQGFNDKLGAVDDTTRALIQKNTDTGISGWARLQQNKADAQRALINLLSTKGLRRSGAKGYGLRRGQLAADQQQQDAIAALLGSVGQQYRGLADSENQRQMQLLQALFSSQFATPYTGGGNPGIRPATPSMGNMQDAINYWQSRPAPTYVSPTTGAQWYGGVGGVESTKFPGKALDSLMGA